MPKIADTLICQMASGQYSHTVTRSVADQMVRAHVAEIIGDKARRQIVRLIAGPSRPVAGTRYSHNHENEQNPPGVFTLRPITHLPPSAFYAVQSSVLI